MIAKCHTAEIQNEVADYISNAWWTIHKHDIDQFWLNRLVTIYDAIWELYRIDAISERTFRALTDPICNFEDEYGLKLLCRFNTPGKW